MLRQTDGGARVQRCSPESWRYRVKAASKPRRAHSLHGAGLGSVAKVSRAKAGSCGPLGKLGPMLLLSAAFQSIRQALDVLDVTPPGLPPGHRHWVEARGHLVNARREVERAIELWVSPTTASTRGGGNIN